MGLAPYGAPGIKLDAFIEPEAAPYRVNHKRLFGNGKRFIFRMTPLLGPARVRESEIDERHKNIAYAVQDACELAVLSIRVWRLKKRVAGICAWPAA